MTTERSHQHRTVAAMVMMAVLTGFAGPACAAAITFDTALPVGEAPLVFREAPRPSDSARNTQEQPPPESRLTTDKDAKDRRGRQRTPRARPRASGPEGR